MYVFNLLTAVQINVFFSYLFWALLAFCISYVLNFIVLIFSSYAEYRVLLCCVVQRIVSEGQETYLRIFVQLYFSVLEINKRTNFSDMDYYRKRLPLKKLTTKQTASIHLFLK